MIWSRLRKLESTMFAPQPPPSFLMQTSCRRFDVEVRTPPMLPVSQSNGSTMSPYWKSTPAGTNPPEPRSSRPCPRSATAMAYFGPLGVMCSKPRRRKVPGARRQLNRSVTHRGTEVTDANCGRVNSRAAQGGQQERNNLHPGQLITIFKGSRFILASGSREWVIIRHMAPRPWSAAGKLLRPSGFVGF